MGTPYVVVFGNKFENDIVEIEEIKSGEKYSVTLKEIGMFLKDKCGI